MSHAGTQTHAPRPRMEWMDTLRGTAIVLVVLWHAPAVPALFGAEVPDALLALDFFFLPFRMPTLMFLSGLLLAPSLRKPLVRYYAGKVAMVVWPYVLWVQLDRVLLGAAHPWFHWRAYYATSYLWFLFFIGVFYAVAPLLRRVPTGVVVLSCAVANVVLPSGTENRMTYFAVFFFLGHLVGRRPAWVDRLTRGPLVWMWAAAGAAVGVLSAVTRLEYAYQVVLAPFSLAGIAAAIAFARWIDGRGQSPRWLVSVGQHSIVYYVSHFPVMVGLVHLFDALSIDQVLVLSVVNAVASMVVGWVLARLRSRAPVRWLFESPRRPTAWLEHKVSATVRRRQPMGVQPTP